jgi:hypothetical protein
MDNERKEFGEVLGQHRHSGELYALRITPFEGEVVALCGPLSKAEAKAWVVEDTFLNFSDDDAEWANKQEWHFPGEVEE